jgi:hypothetical protein
LLARRISSLRPSCISCPMYRHLSRAPSRTLAGHVCLSCRRQLHVTARAQKDEAADDWLSNFNDLSVEAETQSQQKNGTTSDRPGKSKPEKRRSPSEATSFEGLKAKLGYATNARPNGKLQNAALDDISSRALEGIPRDADSTDPVPKDKDKDVRQTYESVLASLMTAPIPTATPAAKDDTQDEPIITFKGGKAHLTGSQKWPGSKRLPAKSEASSDQQNSHLAKKKAGASSTSPVDNILVAGGVTSSSKKTSVQPEDLHHGKPMSIATKARVVRDRPKWGGMTTAPDETGPVVKASFDSLQRADKVSAPPQRPATAFSAQPWGFKGSKNDTGSTDPPGDTAKVRDLESTSTTPARENTEESQSGSFRGMLGFTKLRNMLYGSNSESKKRETAEPEASKPSLMGTQEESRKEEVQITANGQDNVAEPAKESSPRKAAGTDGPEPSGVSSPSPPSASKATSRGRNRNPNPVQRRQARLAAARAKDQKSHKRLVEPADVEAPEDKPLGFKSQSSMNDGQLTQAAPLEPTDVTPSEGATLNSMLQSSENAGRSMSDAMAGRDISGALSSEQDPEHMTEEDHVDDSQSGLPTIEAKGLQITALDIEQPPVPGLSYDLDRVLFNPGVVSLQDQHSRVYNFDPYLQNVMPVEEFDFNALQQYKTSSQDTMLSELARAHNKKYVGSTSSMTSTLSHFHYLLSGWRDLNLGMLSRQFPEERPTFTAINRAPTAIFLRWKNGTYAIDADKEHDSGNILMMLGKSMEKLLTMSKSEYERYRKSDPREITEEERNAPEAYQYTTMGDFLMRSQLDAYDSRLPGTGMFDIKTRSIASIRMSTSDYKPMLGYEILTQQGKWESYEREYYDMMRSTMLKYMLQARMGRMDGIFLAYHNVQRIFGFQYMSMSEIDRAIHGQIDNCLGDQEFKLSVDLLNKVLEEATAKFPNKSLRLHFETKPVPVTAMYVFAEPMEEEEVDKIQSKSKEKIAEFERKMMGIEAREDKSEATKDDTPDNATAALPLEGGTHAPLYAATILVSSIVNGERVERPEHLRPKDDWSVEYLLKEIEDPASAWATYTQCKAKRQQTFSKAIMTDDEGVAESLEDVEPNLEMHEDDGSLRTFESFFLEDLRRMAEKGRKYRRKVDKLEKDNDKVVYSAKASNEIVEKDSTTPSQAPSDVAPIAASSELPSINTVDDYMYWMYGNKENQAPGQAADTTSAEPEITGVDDYMSWMYKDRTSQ